MRTFAVIALSVSLAIPAFADIVKCQQGIEKNGTKLQSSILKALAKCKDSYRKAVVANTPLSTVGPGCQAGLDKVINFSNPISAMAKTKGALDKLVPPAGTSCTDADLAALGYLATNPFGDRWARLILLASLKSAYETQQVLISDLPNIMEGLGTGGCPLCTALATPPCVNTVCDIKATSGFETRLLGVPFPGPITGNTTIAGCEWQNVLPNEIGLIGTPNLGLRPSTVGTSTICNVGFRAMGITSCAGSTAPKISYSLCQDSDTSDGDECVAGADFCQAAPAAGTGGACLTYGALPTAAQGDSYILSTTRLRISTAAGGDGVACTNDDTYTATPASVIPTTTGTVQASVLDYNNTNGNVQTTTSITGFKGPGCATSRSGSSSGLVLVSAFPGADTVGSPLQDTVTKVTIECN